MKPGAAVPINTCATPASHLLVFAAWGRTETQPDGGPVTMVVGMCAVHRPALEHWAWRRWGELGDGMVVPVEDRQALMRELLNDDDADDEIVSPLTGWSLGSLAG